MKTILTSASPVGQVHDLYKTNQVTSEGAVEALVGMGYKRRDARNLVQKWGDPVKSSKDRSEASFDRTRLRELEAWLSTDKKNEYLDYIKKNYDLPEDFNWNEVIASLGDEEFYNELTKAMTSDEVQAFNDDYAKLFSAKKKKRKHPDEVAKDNGADITCSKQICSAKMKEHLIDLADSVMKDEELDLEQFKAMGGDNDQEGILVRAALANMGQIHDPDFDGEDSTEEDDQLVDQVTAIVHENIWKGSKPYTPVFKSEPKSTWKKHLRGLDKLERRNTLKEMYDMCHWEFVNLKLQGTNLNDPENPMMQVAPDLCSDADDIRQFLLECAKENLPGARENLKKVNTLLGIQSSKLPVNSNKQEDLAFIYKAVKQPSVINDPQGPGQIGLVPFHEQLYVEGNNGDTVLIEECSDELIHQIARQVEIERPLGIHAAQKLVKSGFVKGDDGYNPYFAPGAKPNAIWYAGHWVDKDTPWVFEEIHLNTGTITILGAFATEAEANQFGDNVKLKGPDYAYEVDNVLNGSDFDDLHAESLVSSVSVEDLKKTLVLPKRVSDITYDPDVGEYHFWAKGALKDLPEAPEGDEAEYEHTVEWEEYLDHLSEESDSLENAQSRFGDDLKNNFHKAAKKAPSGFIQGVLYYATNEAPIDMGALDSWVEKNHPTFYLDEYSAGHDYYEAAHNLAKLYNSSIISSARVVKVDPETYKVEGTEIYIFKGPFGAWDVHKDGKPVVRDLGLGAAKKEALTLVNSKVITSSHDKSIQYLGDNFDEAVGKFSEDTNEVLDYFNNWNSSGIQFVEVKDTLEFDEDGGSEGSVDFLVSYNDGTQGHFAAWDGSGDGNVELNIDSSKRISSGWVGAKEGDHFVWTSSDGTLVIKPVGKFYALYRNTDEYVDTFESLEDAQGAGDSEICQLNSSTLKEAFDLGIISSEELKSGGLHG